MLEIIIGVNGDAHFTKDNIKWKCAFEVGELLIDNEYCLANCGMEGVMEASIFGAKSSKKYKKGMTIGVLPDYNKSSSNSKADIIIPTGLGLARNVILVSMCDAIIAIGGGSGTLSKIALAWQMNKMIIAIDFDGWSGNLKSMRLDKKRLDKIFEAENAQNAVEILNSNIENYKNDYKGVKKTRLRVNILTKNSFLEKKLVINGVQAKLNSLIRNMVPSAIPINKEANITAFILISIFLILMVRVPEITIVIILANSNDIKQLINKRFTI